MQNRFRASYVRNFIFFDYFDFALKWSDRMIAFAINTFSLVYRYFARWIIMRLNTNWTSSLMSTDLVDVIIWLTIKALLNSTIVNKQLAKYLRVLVQKIVFYQTINSFNAVNLHNQWWQFFFSLMTLLDQITFAIRRFECKISFCFSMRRIIFCWLFVCTSITHTSWVNISKILDIAYADEATFFIKELLIVSRFLAFFERVINFTFSLKKRLVVITFFFIFSIRCRRLISFLTKSVRKLFFSLCSFILKINVFSLLAFFNCFCWLMLLYDAIIVVVVASISRWALIFVKTA